MDIRKLSASSASSADSDDATPTWMLNPGGEGQSVVAQGWKKIRHGPQRTARGPPRPTRPKNEPEGRFPAHLLGEKTSPRSVRTDGLPVGPDPDAMVVDVVDHDKAILHKRGADSLVELMPPPAKKKRATTPMGTGRISRARIEAQLPGAAFGHAAHVLKKEYWTSQDEKALRKTSWGWSAEDEAALAGRYVSDAEAAVHDVLDDVFGRSCADLFRYGLRCARHVLGPTTTTTTTKTRTEADKRADALFWQRLLHLLPHPYWAGDVAKLRFALQMAVLVRVGQEAHAVPVGPPYSAHTDHNNTKSGAHANAHANAASTPEPGFVTWLRQCMPSTAFGEWGVRKEVAYVQEFLFQAQVQSAKRAQHVLDDLCKRHHAHRERARLSSSLSPSASPSPSPPLSLLEHFLFVLRQEDVESLHVTLDSLWVQEQASASASAMTSRPRVPGAEDHSVHGAWQRYVKDRAARGKGPLGNLAKSEVRARLKEATLAARREALIRCRMRAAGEVDRLPDVPPTDPNADFQLWHHLNEAQLLVVDGECMVPSVKRWLVRAAPDQGRDMLWDNYMVMAAKMAHYGADAQEGGEPRGHGHDADQDAKIPDILPTSGLLFSSLPAKTKPEIGETWKHVFAEMAYDDDEDHDDSDGENGYLVGVRARTWREAEGYEPAMGLIFSWTRMEPKAPSVRVARALMSEFRQQPLTALLDWLRRRKEKQGASASARARGGPGPGAKTVQPPQPPRESTGRTPAGHAMSVDTETLPGEHFYI